MSPFTRRSRAGWAATGMDAAARVLDLVPGRPDRPPGVQEVS